MDKIYWKKLNSFQKLIFSLGWLSVLNIGFWIVILIYNTIAYGEKFWSPGSLRVVYVFGWINFIMILFTLIIPYLH